MERGAVLGSAEASGAALGGNGGGGRRLKFRSRLCFRSGGHGRSGQGGLRISRPVPGTEPSWAETPHVIRARAPNMVASVLIISMD